MWNENKINEYYPRFSYAEDLRFWKEEYFYFKKLENKYIVPLLAFEDAAIERFGIETPEYFSENRLEGLENKFVAKEIENHIKDFPFCSGAGSIYKIRWFRRGVERSLICLALTLAPQDIHKRWHALAAASRLDEYSALVDEIVAYDFSAIASEKRLYRERYKLSQFKRKKGYASLLDDEYRYYDISDGKFTFIVVDDIKYIKFFDGWGNDVCISKITGFLTDSFLSIPCASAEEWGSEVLGLKNGGLIDSAVPVIKIDNEFIERLKQENRRLGFGINIPDDLTGRDF